MPPPVQDELETDLQVRPDGYARVTLRGWLNAETTVACWNKLERDLRGAKISTLEVDASGLQLCGGAGLALLRYLNMGKMTPKASVSVIGLEPGLDKLFRGFTAEDYEAFRPSERIKCQSLPTETGTAVRHVAADLREVVAFIGEIAAKLPTTIWNRERMRWP